MYHWLFHLKPANSRDSKDVSNKTANGPFYFAAFTEWTSAELTVIVTSQPPREAGGTSTKVGSCVATCAPRTVGLFVWMRTTDQRTQWLSPSPGASESSGLWPSFEEQVSLSLSIQSHPAAHQLYNEEPARGISIHHHSLKPTDQIWHPQDTQSHITCTEQTKAPQPFNESSHLQSVIMQRTEPGSIKNGVEYENLLPQYYCLFIIHGKVNSQNSLFLNWQK